MYIYDELGAPIGIKYRTPSYAENVYDCYFFEKNLQGDIVAIYNASGAKIVTYTYDAWGNVTTKITSGTSSKDRNIANNNPFRYRGYYYDTDIGMYYLQSRYYNPEWGRFLSADSYDVITITPMDLTDKNLFAYCDNNPITRIDEDGEFWNVVAGAVVGGLVTGISELAMGTSCKKITFWTSVAFGAAEGALTALFPSASIAISSGISSLESITNGVIENKRIGDIVIETGMSAFFGAVSGADGSDFVKGGLMNDAVDSLGDLWRDFWGKGITKKAYRQAKSTLKKAVKQIKKPLFDDFPGNCAFSALEKGAAWYYKKIAERCFGW